MPYGTNRIVRCRFGSEIVDLQKFEKVSVSCVPKLTELLGSSAGSMMAAVEVEDRSHFLLSSTSFDRFGQDELMSQGSR